MTERRGRPDVATLWLKTHQEIADRCAHELRNSLNAVSVNLEVVRSRLARKGVDLTTVTPFAETAADSMDGLSALAEAFLALGRPARQPADVGAILRNLFTLLEPLARVKDEEARFQAPAAGEGVTAAAADITRLTLACLSLEALKAPATVDCRVEAVDETRFALRFAGWFPIQLPDAILYHARAAHILFDEGEGDGVRLTFPVYRG